jgi:magnesium chelatase family protein
MAATLREVCEHLMGCIVLPTPVFDPSAAVPLEALFDLADVKGQMMARLALELAAAGGHSLLMQGTPGTGKSMLAARLAGILPPMTEQESIESAAVASLGKQGFSMKAWGVRPFRSPHHSSSAAALVGGGSDPKPGEISLAHHGVLFLDELPEFDRKVLENLREPLESGVIQLSRVAKQVTYPAKFQLIAAMNPCPCGFFGHPTRACHCTPNVIARYKERLSGPLMDRIDLCCDVPTIPADDLMTLEPGESTKVVRERVVLLRSKQLDRQGMPNAHLQGKAIDRYCVPSAEAKTILMQAMDKLGLSARAYHRILKVARTLADRTDADLIQREHVLAALQFRRGLSQ